MYKPIGLVVTLAVFFGTLPGCHWDVGTPQSSGHGAGANADEPGVVTNARTLTSLANSVAQDDQPDSALSSCISDLSDVDPDVRIQAARKLAQLGPRAAAAAKPLMDAVDREKDIRARKELLRTLPRLGTAAREALPKLIPFVEKQELAYDDYVTFITTCCNSADVATLIRHSEHAVWHPPLYLIETKRIRPEPKAVVPALVDVLSADKQDKGKVEQSVMALRPFKEAAAPAVDALIGLLRRRSPKSLERPPVELVIDSLPHIGKAASASVPEILRFKDDPKCVKSIAIALPYLTDDAKVAVPPLIHLLERKHRSNLDDARLLAIQSLGDYGPAASSALPAIKAAWRNKEDPLYSTAFQTHREAVEVLSSTFFAIGDASIPIVLGAAGEQHPYFADCVVSALGKRFGVRSLAAIERHLTEKSYAGGSTLVAVLMAMKRQDDDTRVRIAHALVVLSSNEDFKTRALAVEALGNLGERDNRVVLALQEASNDRQSKQVREAAQTALRKLMEE